MAFRSKKTQTEKDRRFLESLLPENGKESCKRAGCQRPHVKDYMYCAKHYFEAARGTPCPWQISEDGLRIKGPKTSETAGIHGREENCPDSRGADHQTVVFPANAGPIFPYLCVGCIEGIPQEVLFVPIGASSWIGTAILCSPLFGPASIPLARAQRDPYVVAVPICPNCVARLSASEKKQLDWKPGVFRDHPSRISNSYFNCHVVSGCVSMTFHHARFAECVRALNKGVVYDSVESVLSRNQEL